MQKLAWRGQAGQSRSQEKAFSGGSALLLRQPSALPCGDGSLRGLALLGQGDREVRSHGQADKPSVREALRQVEQERRQ